MNTGRNGFGGPNELFELDRQVLRVPLFGLAKHEIYYRLKTMINQTSALEPESNLKSLKRNLEWPETVSKWLTSVSKIGAFVSLPTSIFFIVQYLGSAGSPIPGDILTGGGTLALVAVLFALTVMPIAFTLVAPITIRIFHGRLLASSDQKVTLSKRLQTYWLCCGPLLSVAVLGFEAVVPPEWFLPAVIFLLSAVHSVVWWLYVRDIDFRPDLSSVMWGVLVSAIWGALLVFIADIVLAQQESVNWLRGGLSLAIVVLVISHYIIVTAVNNIHKTAVLLVGVTFVLTMIYPGPAYWGATFLNRLRIGGDLPVHISLKNGTINAQKDPADLAAGCLVLATGSELVIRLDAEKRRCNPKMRVPPWRVRVSENLTWYSRSEIANIAFDSK